MLTFQEEWTEKVQYEGVCTSGKGLPFHKEFGDELTCQVALSVLSLVG